MKKAMITDQVLHLETYWPYQLTVLADRVSRRTTRVVKEKADLNLSQWRVLAAIAEEPGRTAIDVVTVTPMDKGIVSRGTKTLLEMGLILREASQDDGRVSHLYLTKQGQALYQRLIPEVEAVLTRAYSVMSLEEQKKLGFFLGQLLTVIPDQR
jgi:DNA-binding MarR family transcriptional regulator